MTDEPKIVKCIRNSELGGIPDINQTNVQLVGYVNLLVT